MGLDELIRGLKYIALYLPWTELRKKAESILTQAVERLEAQQARIRELEEQQRWIPVGERLPQPETEVMILAQHKTYSFKGNVTTRHIMTTGMYEDGSKNTEDSGWHWETDGFDYDEELDAYIIPEGWWEYKHYNGDDEYNHPIDDTVTHWMPLPGLPEEAANESDT